VLKNFLLASLVLLSSFAQADYVYESGQSLIDLTGATDTTNLGASDDGVSNAFDLDFTFDYYGQAFTQARVATNGCLHFKTSGDYCNDWTPDPITDQHTYTLYPFWTDLIRNEGSKVLAKSYTDKTVFGWYDMQEYGRGNSDNSFEVILWTNDTYEFRYGALDITDHDVLIGEKGNSSQIYQYLFHDECSTGSTNVTGTCTNTDWNDTAFNTLLENGGSLYSDGSDNSIDCSEPLNNVNCSGYAAAYLTQQCGLNDLYNESCSGYAAAYLTQQCDIDDLYSQFCTDYWSAYDTQQCSEDSQYSPSCAGYSQEESVAYYVEEDMWYDEEYDEWLDPNDPCYENRCEGFTDADWYELDIEQFGQEQVDEWYGNDVEFSNDGYIEYGTVSEEEYWTAIDDGMNEYDEELWQQEEPPEYQEQNVYAEEEIPYEELPLIEEEIWIEEIYIVEHETTAPAEIYVIEEEFIELPEQREQEIVLEIFDAEELIEIFEFETIIREELIEERIAENENNEELEEELEEIREELEESEEELIEDREELLAEEGEDKKERKSSARISALDVVASTIQTARESASNDVNETINNVTNTITQEISETENNETSVSEQIVFNNTNPVSSVISNVISSGGSSSTGYVSGVSSSTRTTYNSAAQSTSAGGTSTTNSPSVSEQFASAAAQTQQVLSLNFSTSEVSNGSTSSNISSSNTNTFSNSSSTVSISIIPTLESSPQVVMAEVQVTNMNNEIDTAVSGIMTASEADQIADQIIAQNIQNQQEESETEQQQTGSYSDETTLVAYLGYVSGFDSYREVQIPRQETWYKARAIYANAILPDNTQAFYSMAGDSISTLSNMINSQPNL